jgi:hypothetical protein
MTRLLVGLTLASVPLIIRVWILAFDKFLSIPGGRVGYKRAFTAFKTSIRIVAAQIIHSIGAG